MHSASLETVLGSPILQGFIQHEGTFPLLYRCCSPQDHCLLLAFSSATRFSLSSSFMATMTYAISTTFAMIAAVAPAHVEFPGENVSVNISLYRAYSDRPWNIVFKVKKYSPIGPAIIAAVKPKSLYMTNLPAGRSEEEEGLQSGPPHVGTAGVILDFSNTFGVVPSWSFVSERLFPIVVTRLVAIDGFSNRAGKSG